MTDDQLTRQHTTRQLEAGLRALQTVKTFDYADAYFAAFGGGHVLNPGGDKSSAEWFEGRCRALNLKLRLWEEYRAERDAREAARG